MIEQHEVNRAWWNHVTPVHVQSKFYDVPAFLRGESTLDEFEQAAFTSVEHKSLLHLQCHFGLASLSFARMGANVTGVDFSEASITAARELARKSGLESRCRFVLADVLELDTVLSEPFDRVFTSYGAITWLSDLQKWGRVVASLLKPGGEFFIADVHPLSMIFEEEAGELRVRYDYFHDPRGVEFAGDMPDYADHSFFPQLPTREWQWTVADILSALTDAGLQVTEVNELPYSCFQHFPMLTENSSKMWEFPPGKWRVPLTLVVKAGL